MKRVINPGRFTPKNIRLTLTAVKSLNRSTANYGEREIKRVAAQPLHTMNIRLDPKKAQFLRRKNGR